MNKYIITLDGGTTNTRGILWNENDEIVSSFYENIGVRNTAMDGNNSKLVKTVKDGLAGLLEEGAITWDEIRCIVASGMLTSNVGIVEIPHLIAPVKEEDFIENLSSVLLEDIAPIPINFVPGVKNDVPKVDEENFTEMDIMRGEEVECLALMKDLNSDKEYALILPGSHTKFVSVGKGGVIRGCLTTISGELLNSITDHTIIADAVGRDFVHADTYSKEMILLGYSTAEKLGLGKAAFSGRILSQFTDRSPRDIANYILGATLQNDISALKESKTLCINEDTEIIISGKEVLQKAFYDILSFDGTFKDVRVIESGEISLSAKGGYHLASCIK